ncbi:hypothetical protein [Pseudoalteromonas sp. S16_S37]|uniref:hypothetical protein n=1 Tax=Pseudoalteromonas sp. S16_S37 TaxID=2720228 RepID=UPI0016812773|nr:hypothetical protein [Pseudoalteromonas sp. S16_S37]MBD1582186.1 hypothetical protein [Pseudoalteromonas sp. S16_S37]
MIIKASLLVTAILASVSCFAAQTYQVSTSVYSQGKLVGAPTMIVEADKMASFAMDNGFSYNLTVKPNQDETVGVEAAVTVGDSTINPSFTVIYDKEATLEIGTQKLTLLISKNAN